MPKKLLEIQKSPSWSEFTVLKIKRISEIDIINSDKNTNICTFFANIFRSA